MGALVGVTWGCRRGLARGNERTSVEVVAKLSVRESHGHTHELFSPCSLPITSSISRTGGPKTLVLELRAEALGLSVCESRRESVCA